ncbi:MAG: hypothetical protein L0177_12285 [Chloroflexi bacterium]|nr:hypothetical protein [Chloroflexota bacterium]
MKNRLGAFMGIVVAALGIVAAACSSAPAALSEEEYFDRLDAIITEFGDSFDQMEGPDATDLENEEAALAAFRAAFQGALDTLDGAIADMKEINPPSDLREAHDDFVRGFEQDVRPLFAGMVERLEGAETMEDAIEVFFSGAGDFDDIQPSQSFIDACNTLQARADRANRAIDLGCEDL